MAVRPKVVRGSEEKRGRGSHESGRIASARWVCSLGVQSACLPRARCWIHSHPSTTGPGKPSSGGSQPRGPPVVILALVTSPWQPFQELTYLGMMARDVALTETHKGHCMFLLVYLGLGKAGRPAGCLRSHNILSHGMCTAEPDARREQIILDALGG